MEHDWQKQVFKWLSGRALKLERKPEPPKPLSRFLFDLDAYVAHATDGSPRHAATILQYFYCARRDGKDVDSRALAYVLSAECRYKKDPNRNMAKALGFVRTKEGRPAGERVTGTLTPDAKIEIASDVKSEVAEGGKAGRAVKIAAEMFGVTERTIKRVIAEARRDVRTREPEPPSGRKILS